ncbi:MAG: ROK family protein [Bacteroidota bacterium]
MNQITIGVDLGATKTKVGVVQNSVVIDEIEFPTSSQGSKEQIIGELINGIEEISNQNILGIGIGVPGLIDEEKGIIYNLWNIPSWKEVHLKSQLEDHFHKPVRITNDANVFALGEKMFGKGGPYKNLVGVTLGSGFGTGIIIDHKLYSGSYSSAGEMANLPYLDKTIEDYCSGKFFFNEHGLKGDEVAKLAEKGNLEALKIFKEFGHHLGNSLKLILNILSPEAIFLGGSISKSYVFFEESLLETINTFPFKKVRDQLVVEPSTTSNTALLGSAALILAQQYQADSSS